MSSNETYHRLIEWLNKNQVQYRLIDHPAEGRTEIVSPMRGNKLHEAAKCMIMMVKLDRKTKKYILGVVPGDARIDLNAVKRLFNARYVSFATPEIAEELAGSVIGTVLPFTFNEKLELVVDPFLLKNEEIYFNAARLDQSMVMKTSDYQTLAKPRLMKIAEYQVVAD